MATSFLLLLAPLLRGEALQSHTLLLQCTASFQVLDLNYLCSRSLAPLTQPGWGWESIHAVSPPSRYRKHVLPFSPLHSFYSILRALHPLWGRGGTGLITLGCFFLQINQTPLITQMIEIQLFGEWYTVLINLNLHCMSRELMFLFLIAGNLAGGSDWINRSRFSRSACENCGVAVACRVLHTQRGRCLQPAGEVTLLAGLWSAATGDTIRVDRGDRLHSRVIYYSSVKSRHTKWPQWLSKWPLAYRCGGLGCMLNWSDSRAGWGGFRPLPSQENSQNAQRQKAALISLYVVSSQTLFFFCLRVQRRPSSCDHISQTIIHHVLCLLSWIFPPCVSSLLFPARHQ